MAKAPSKVAAFLADRINASAKTQAEIANEAGFRSANMISMLKMGNSPLPIARIPKIAQALDVDPVKLFRLAMNEYMPDVLAVADMVYGRDKLTDGEQEILDRIRLHTGGKNFKVTAAVNRAVDDLCALIK